MNLQTTKKMTMTEKTTKPIIGTHNSMTYLRPQHWYGYFMLPVARCQRKNLLKQWEAGARCFDLRIRFTEKGRAYFAHGLYECCYGSTNPYDALFLLAAQAIRTKEDTYVRLILEDPDRHDYCVNYFTEYCDFATLNFSDHLHFFGGNRKGDWKKIYTFKEDVPDSLNNQWVSSMAEDARWYEKAFPFLYAWRMNKKNKIKMKEKFNLFDFI